MSGWSAGTALAAPPQIYWTNFVGNTIGAANLDGTGVNQSFITGANAPGGLAVDANHIYWSNLASDSIGVANLDGTGVNQSFITGTDGPYAVAVDGQHIYWTNGNGNSIGEANLDGTGVNQSFITGADAPYALAVNGQHIYWTNANNTIGDANLDGTGVNESLITVGTPLAGLAVDDQRIYWASDIANTIGAANLDGTDVNQSLISGLNDVNQIAVDDQHIYWANYTGSTGTTVGEANLDGTNVNENLITGASAPEAVAVSVPVASSSSLALAFGTTARGSVSSPLMVTLTNTGEQVLALKGLSFSGTAAGDFFIGSDTCLGGVAPGSSCQLGVYFSPQGSGSRTATLDVASTDYANSPLQIALSGTGGSLPTGPTGATGPPGPPGPQGPPGKVELITCKTVIKKVGGHRHKVQKCTGKLVSGTVKFTTTGAVRASIVRGGQVFATGTSVAMGHGLSQLVLTDLRPLRRGRYTLTLRRQGRRTVITRQQITIN